MVALALAIPIGGLLLARRNLRLGRGDRRGAFRVARFVFASYSVARLLRADHVSAPAEEVWLLGLSAAYQMLRLRLRMLRRLPFGRAGRRPLGANGWVWPPPGPAAGRSVASLTRSRRPPSSWPSNFWIAAAATSSVVYSTKAKPRGRPVIRSLGIETLTISPACANSSCSSSVVVSKLRLPTNSLEAMAHPSFSSLALAVARVGSGRQGP